MKIFRGMINVNDRIIKEDLPNKIGVDGFAILFAIASHLGKSGSKTAWPGRKRICEMCKTERAGKLAPMSRERFYSGMKRLINHDLVARWQESKQSGDFGATKYKITTKYISIFMDVTETEMEDTETPRITESRSRMTEKRNPLKRNPQNRSTEDINKGEDINHIKERERAHEKESNIQPKQKNVPSKVAAKVSLDINPLKYESTAIFFAKQMKDTFPDLIPDLQKIVSGKIGDHIKAYFLNLQKKDEWFQLQEPKPEKLNHWISKHYAGVRSWLKNEKKFWPPKQDKSKAIYKAPQDVFTADQLKKSA